MLKVDPREARGFSGSAEIHVVATRPHRVVWLSARDLRITSASVQGAVHGPIPASWEALGETGMGKLTFSETMPPGDLTLRMAFEGSFGQGQRGLYRVTEAEIPYAYTQLEPTSARSVFPCFDEPSFKISFRTTLIVPTGQTAIGNTQEVERKLEGNDERVTFAATPPIPSYLVAFAVGPFDVVPAPDVPANALRRRTVPLRAITPRGRGKEVAYALSYTGDFLQALEHYFGIEYPYDKLDIIAVPGKPGAMENVGALTFGESVLLMDEATVSVRRRGRNTSVMAHELAHQWSGDLVTPRWWDDTWLNEAFATWISGKIVEAWDPKLHVGVTRLGFTQDAMDADADANARSIRQPIESANDIETAFDSLTYFKGAAVLQMFEHWVGADAWQQGVHAFLQAHAFGNATADDFLDAEDRATGKAVKTAFHTFLDQPGVPLVNARLGCPKPTTQRPSPRGPDPIDQEATLYIEQSRFLPLGSTGDSHRTWQVPVCVSTPGSGPGDRGEHCVLLGTASGTIDLDRTVRCPPWVMPNANAVGYYRSVLDPADLAKLRTGLPSFTAREKIEYAASLRVAYLLGQTPTKDIFDGEAPFARETETAVAAEPMAYVTEARRWLHGGPLQAKVEAYGARLYAPALAKLGWDAKKDEDGDRRALRGTVLGFLVTTGRDRAVIAEATKRGERYLDLRLTEAGLSPLHRAAPAAGPAVKAELARVDQNISTILLLAAAEQADTASWEAMKSLLLKSVDEVVRSQVLSAISVANNPVLAARARQLATDPALRETEVLTPLTTQLSRAETQDDAWAWEKAHYDEVRGVLSKQRGGMSLIGSTRVFCDEAHANDVLEFFTPRVEAIEGGKRTLASTVEEIRLCATRRKVHEPALRAMFRNL